MKYLAGLASLLILGSQLAWARSTKPIDHQTLSIRALGMGGAIAAGADDYNALAFNPAGLALLERRHIRGSIGLAWNQDIIDITQDIRDVDEDLSESREVDEVTDILLDQFDREPYLRLTPLSGVGVLPGMGFSFTPMDATVELNVDNPANPALDIVTTIDATARFGYGRTVQSALGTFAVGGAAKAIYRAHYNETKTALDIVRDDDYFETSDADEGLTFDVDLGVMFLPEIASGSIVQYFKPTFALVVRNLLDYGFPANFHFVDDDSGEPPKLERRIDVGTKLEFPAFAMFRPRLLFDVRDMTHSNWTFKKGYHVGAELEWFMRNWWRGAWRVGINQGYWTAGISAKLFIFQLDAASWGEEIGTANKTEESRRYMVTLSIDI